MSSWKECKLGDVLELITKGTTPPNGQGFVNLGINYIKSDAINYNGRIDKSKFVQIDLETHEKFKRSQLKEFDILFSMAGAYLGKNAIVTSEILPANTNQALAILRLNQTLAIPRYVSYYLSQNEIIDFVNNMSGQSAQPNINFQEISSIPLLLPPLEEQKAIAEVLSSLDDKIDLLHRQNQILESLAQTLFRQWFIEEAKEEWEVGKLGDILSIIESGSRPKGGIDPELKNGFASIGAESINGIGNFNFKSTKYITEDFFSSLKRGIVNTYDVLIYKDGAYIGRKAMFGNCFPFEQFAINEHVFILRCNEKANQFFLYFLLEQDELATLNANSAQPGLNQESMKSFEILIPPYELIEKFGIIVKDMVDKILFNSKQIQTLENLRDTLLPKLLSGEVRVEI